MESVSSDHRLSGTVHPLCPSIELIKPWYICPVCPGFSPLSGRGWSLSGLRGSLEEALHCLTVLYFLPSAACCAQVSSVITMAYTALETPSCAGSEIHSSLSLKSPFQAAALSSGKALLLKALLYQEASSLKNKKHAVLKSGEALPCVLKPTNVACAVQRLHFCLQS